MQRRLDPETDVNKPLKMFLVRGVFRIFFREEAPTFVTFLSVFFPAKLILSNLSTNNDSRGVQGHAEPFEHLHSVLVILVLIEQFLGKVCHIFSP